MNEIPDLTQYFLAAIGVLLTVITFNTRDIVIELRKLTNKKK